ncbi:MAG: DUF5716 family protein [Eubacteriales bacterium]|nr:DUF5716 family protein [Eubacteriales bacterium]
MKMNDGRERLYVGVDYREECPQVCYQDARMKEPQPIPLEFGEQAGRSACFRKILSALRRFAAKEDIQAALVLPDLAEETVEQYVQKACEAGFSEEQLLVIGEAESMVCFAMNQTSDIWQHRVWLLEFHTDEVKATFMDVNRRSVPMLARTGEPEYWRVGNLLEGSRDEKLAQIAKERFGEAAVSGVFLTGTDFNARDYRHSREEICFHRRVFLGDRIHARGACMAARSRGGKKSYLYLNEQTLLYNVGIQSRRSGKESLYTLISAGCSWYEARTACELLLEDGEPLLEFSFQSMLGGEPLREGLMLNGLPKRAGGLSRLLLEMRFCGPLECEVKVTDLGFGELYPASDLYWKESFSLEGREEAHGAGDDL